jgi:hypothetical protein
MTKLEYLQRLPETYNGLPLRKMALENYKPNFSKVFNADNLHHAICIGIQWYNTPEGYKFWEGIAKEALKGELKIIDNQIKMEL